MTLTCALDFLNGAGKVGCGLQSLLRRHTPSSLDKVQALLAIDGGLSSHFGIIAREKITIHRSSITMHSFHLERKSFVTDER
jgi:hypothetical protein